MGNPELRSLLVLGASSVLRHARGNDKAPKWLSALLARRPYKVVAVALANKTARAIWALLTRDISRHGTGKRRSKRLNRKSATTNCQRGSRQRRGALRR